MTPTQALALLTVLGMVTDDELDFCFGTSESYLRPEYDAALVELERLAQP